MSCDHAASEHETEQEKDQIQLQISTAILQQTEYKVQTDFCKYIIQKSNLQQCSNINAKYISHRMTTVNVKERKS